MIAIDGVPAAKENKTGVEWYVFHLLKEMHKLRPDLDVTVYSHKPININFTGNWKNKILNWPFPGWSKIRWSMELLKEQPQTVFVPGDELPSILPGRVITTIHDIGFRHVPKLYTAKNRRRQERAHRRAAERAECITITNQTKKDFIKFFEPNPEKIHQVYLGFNQAIFYKREDQDKELIDFRKEKNVTEDYFYFVSRVEKRKGADILIEAYKLYKENGGKTQLIVAGPIVDKEIQRTASDTPSIQFVGYVNEKENALHMSAAKAFIFPTKKEGFGIPIIEALASGTPVICSDLAVLREIGGNAPIFLNNKNPQEWAEEMQNDHSDRIEEGISHAKKFSWQETAKQTLKILLNE